MRLTFVGTGDAFGAGGRLQTCLHVTAPGSAPMLIDCGVTSLIGMQRLALRVEDIEAVVITHLHGDHFGGLVWLLLDSAYGRLRQKPLTIFGPPTTQERLSRAIEVFYPGALARPPAFPYHIVELDPAQARRHQGYSIAARVVDHPSGAPSFGVRITANQRSLAFTGDTAWTEAVVALGQQADAFVMDCWKPEGTPAVHMSYEQIAANLPRLDAHRIYLTHMGEEMLTRAPMLETERVRMAFDGLVVDI